MQPETPYQPPVTQPTEPTYQPQQPQAPVEQHNPGKTLAIVGFIFAFIGLQIIGLILSIVGLAKSKKAGMKNGLAVAGIILNIVFMVITVLLITITIVAYAGVKDRAKTTEARSAAYTTIAEVENYRAEHNGIHPTTRADLTNTTATLNATPLLGAPADPNTVALWSCVDNIGNAVEYWDYSASKAVLIYTDEDIDPRKCSFIEE